MGRRKRYSAEFKKEALRRADEPGVSDLLVAEELGINARQLRRSRDAVKRDGDGAVPGQDKSRDEEMTRLGQVDGYRFKDSGLSSGMRHD